MTAEASAPTRREGARAYLLRHRSNLPIIAIFLLIVIGFSLTTERFFTVVNIANVLRQGSPLVIMAVGATFVLVAAGIDLSIGAVVSITGVTIALVLKVEPGYVGLAFAFGLAVVIGAFNGFLIAYQRLPSFIVTLGTLSVLTGISQLLARGLSIAIDTDPWLIGFGQARVGIVPVPVLIALLVAVVGWVLLNRTPYGLRVRGIGSNEESVRRSGVPVNLLVASVYVVSTVTAALGGVVVAMRLQSGNSTAGTGLELQAIAAVVLGGTSLFGGKGSVIGSVLGVYTLGFIENGLILNHVDVFYVRIIQGAILLAALWANTKVFARLK